MKKALLVLDIQQDYFSEHGRMPVAKQQIEPLLTCINDLIKKAIGLDVPVIYIRNEFEWTQLFSNLLRKFTALKGSKGAEYDKRLLQVEGVSFSKNKADAFSNPHLATYLSNNDIHELIVTGVFSEGCVSATVNGALTRNFTVTVVEDAVAGATDNSRDVALSKLATQDVLIYTSQQIFESKSHEGGNRNDHFAKINPAG